MCPLELLDSGSVTTPAGFRAGVASAGIRSARGPDVAILTSHLPCSGAGVFTRNRVRAAPVIFDEARLLERPGRLRGVVMNAANANACTGEAGLRDAETMAAAAEEATESPARTFLVLSTGVIGVPLPIDKVTKGITKAAKALAEDGGMEAARAIMTTDTRPKYTAVSIVTPNGPIHVGGIAKGAGMIHPNMATLLGILTTDARVDAARLQALLAEVTDRSFNAITVDGDTSTNDSVIALANGASEIDVSRDTELWKVFSAAVEQVARHLALEVVRDGEGATRLVELTVTGANTEAVARTVGRSIARSLLVKTAIHGGDPNWGRLLAAAGATDHALEPERISLDIQARAPEGGPLGEWIPLAREGAGAGTDESILAKAFSADEIAIRLDLNRGGASATVWTCDLSADYVRINADYRT